MLAAGMGMIVFGYACLYAGIERFRGNPTSIIAALGGKGGKVTQATGGNGGSSSGTSSGSSSSGGTGGNSYGGAGGQTLSGGSASLSGSASQGTQAV